MSAKSDVTYTLVNQEEKGYSFIKGHTKFLKDMSQDELAILSGNGDSRVKAEEKKPAKVAAISQTV